MNLSKYLWQFEGRNDAKCWYLPTNVNYSRNAKCQIKELIKINLHGPSGRSDNEYKLPLFAFRQEESPQSDFLVITCQS